MVRGGLEVPCPSPRHSATPRQFGLNLGTLNAPGSNVPEWQGQATLVSTTRESLSPNLRANGHLPGVQALSPVRPRRRLELETRQPAGSWRQLHTVLVQR